MDSANKIRDAFESIRAGEELKASTRAFLRTARQKEENRTAHRKKVGHNRSIFRIYPVFRWAFGAICAMLIMFLGAGGYALLLEPVAYVSIDVNPSLELALNRLNLVISATAYNEDGEFILKNVSINGKSYTDAIDLLVESDVMQPYLTEDSALTFTVAAADGHKEEILLSGINNCSGCRQHGGVSFSTDINTLNTAHENGLSLGRYAAYSILSEYDDSITTEDCHNMTMAEINGLIEAHKHGNGAGHENDYDRENQENPDSGGHGRGHGHGHGHGGR